mmetsp:Transcript_32958/g.52797  ORF Transcript_32958/g.52797 Transcript_32958/m.52797 type:complete len:139 (-) Transcript_32958:559-975(-)
MLPFSPVCWYTFLIVVVAEDRTLKFSLENDFDESVVVPGGRGRDRGCGIGSGTVHMTKIHTEGLITHRGDLNENFVGMHRCATSWANVIGNIRMEDPTFFYDAKRCGSKWSSLTSSYRHEIDNHGPVKNKGAHPSTWP